MWGKLHPAAKANDMLLAYIIAQRVIFIGSGNYNQTNLAALSRSLHYNGAIDLSPFRGYAVIDKCMAGRGTVHGISWQYRTLFVLSICFDNDPGIMTNMCYTSPITIISKFILGERLLLLWDENDIILLYVLAIVNLSILYSCYSGNLWPLDFGLAAKM